MQGSPAEERRMRRLDWETCAEARLMRSAKSSTRAAERLQTPEDLKRPNDRVKIEGAVGLKQAS